MINNNERRLSIMMTDKSKANVDFAMALFENSKSKSSYANNLLEIITPEICISAKCLADETGRDYQDLLRDALLKSITPKNIYKLNWIKRLYEGEIIENVCRDIFGYLNSLILKGVEINTDFSSDMINFFSKTVKYRIKPLEEYSVYLSYESHLLHDFNILITRILNAREKSLNDDEKMNLKSFTRRLKQNSIMSICLLLLDNWSVVKHYPETYSVMKSLSDLYIDCGEYSYTKSNELIHIIFSNKITEQ